MSDYLPFEIQVEIITKLPVKSLIRFRSVSKPWKSFIESSAFMADYVRHHKHAQHLLVSYTDFVDSDVKYVSVVDDDATFPLHRVSVPVTPLLNSFNYSYDKVGCSHGLLCLHGVDPVTGRGMVILWNLTIRKSVAVTVPKVWDKVYGLSLGFGVCRETIDPKIVKITQTNTFRDVVCLINVPRKVEVFTLSTGAWRPSLSSNLPRESIIFDEESLEVNGVLYWVAYECIGNVAEKQMIISFDMTSEEFDEVNLPYDSDDSMFSMFKIRESLVLIEDFLEYVDVWMMEDGVSKSFMKAFTIHKPDHEHVGAGYAFVRGFRKNAAPLVEVLKGEDDVYGVTLLVVYEPYANYIDKFWIQSKGDLTFVIPYMETLLLLDKPDRMVYNDNLEL